MPRSSNTLYPVRKHDARITMDQLDWYCLNYARALGLEWNDVPVAEKAKIAVGITAVLEELGFQVW